VPRPRWPNALKRFLKILGPGLVTGASDDDPSGIGTYAVAGASLGYATLWTALITLPLMAAVQFMCAKIGMVSGRGLSGVLREQYPRQLLYAAVLGLIRQHHQRRRRYWRDRRGHQRVGAHS
jgi:Mn2+/Fe2+ NRAMP family transporter